MDREQAKLEFDEMMKEAEADIAAGRVHSMEEVHAHFKEMLSPQNTIYPTGDTHGRFERVVEFCKQQEVIPESTFIILGDGIGSVWGTAGGQMSRFPMKSRPRLNVSWRGY